MKVDTFLYVADNYEYVLKAVYKVNGAKRIRTLGAELWGRNGKYYGFWDRGNMPMNLVYQIEMRCRYLYARGAFEENNGVFREPKTVEIDRPI